MRRMWDLTYRVNAGALKYAGGSVKTASEPIVSKGGKPDGLSLSVLVGQLPDLKYTKEPRQNLSFQVLQLHKHLHPSQVQFRFSIIRDESFGDRDDFENNGDLTAIDRRIIVSARGAIQ